MRIRLVRRLLFLAGTWVIFWQFKDILLETLEDLLVAIMTVVSIETAFPGVFNVGKGLIPGVGDFEVVLEGIGPRSARVERVVREIENRERILERQNGSIERSAFILVPCLLNTFLAL